MEDLSRIGGLLNNLIVFPDDITLKMVWEHHKDNLPEGFPKWDPTDRAFLVACFVNESPKYVYDVRIKGEFGVEGSANELTVTCRPITDIWWRCETAEWIRRDGYVI
jgi:hypothetical protein